MNIFRGYTPFTHDYNFLFYTSQEKFYRYYSMKPLIFAVMFFVVSGLFASAPLESGYAMAPRASASAEEKNLAYLNARNLVINAAVKYENTPYRYGGMTAAGLDCSGFILLAFRDALGVNLPRSTAGLYSWAEKIPLEKAQPGDLLFFRTDNTGNITHVGLYLGYNRFIHSASTGSRTGVIYTNLNEGSWSRTIAGAGRVFPEVPPGLNFDNNPAVASAGSSSRSGIFGDPGVIIEPNVYLRPDVASGSTGTRYLIGAAIAPTWNGILRNGNLLRGFTSQFRFATDTDFFGPRMILGLEIRPEYDSALGVFRLPITVSWGPSDIIRFFAGPVISFGDASLSTSSGVRHYYGGTTWLGTIGVFAAPFSIETTRGAFAPYFEMAWQSYFSSSSRMDLNADFSANIRFSSGIRWTRRIR